MTQYDYIVVGAGSTGCVVASRLSEDADVEVVLLEAGGSDDMPEIHDPGTWTHALQGTEIDWRYETVPQEHGPIPMQPPLWRRLSPRAYPR